MMNLLTQSIIAESGEMQRRYAAAAASHGVTDPMQWARDHTWALAITPGWCCAVGEECDLTAITDTMIADAVADLLTPEPEPEPEPETEPDEDEPGEEPA